VNDKNGLAFYPDWPTPTFYDTIVAQLQELINGSKQPNDVLTSLGKEYDSYAKDFQH
jgi:raffinose/stachyose/melibiose transport system substrate-binding protein